MVLETYSLYELLEEPQLVPEKFLKDLSRSYKYNCESRFLDLEIKGKGFSYLYKFNFVPICAYTHCWLCNYHRSLEGTGK